MLRCKELNLHSALDPALRCEGFYGREIHGAVRESGGRVSGGTVHFADDEYDHGPIVLQAPVPVRDDDSAETLAARVQLVERELYPEAVRLWAEKRLEIRGRRVRILPPHD